MPLDDALSPDPVDMAIGARIRLRRKSLNMTQGALAGRIGVTFQQVQKYERGANRVSASMMVRAAKAQGVAYDFYFDGLDQADSLEMTEGALKADAWLRSSEGWRLAEAMAPLGEPHRAAVLRVARSLGEAMPA